MIYYVVLIISFALKISRYIIYVLGFSFIFLTSLIHLSTRMLNIIRESLNVYTVAVLAAAPASRSIVSGLFCARLAAADGVLGVNCKYNNIRTISV